MENGDLYVQWFPGHMARTRRQIKESLPFVDAVVEIVDARVPVSSRNPELPELIGQKPLMVILNKCDLADENATRRRISELGKQGVTAIAVDCRSGKGLNAFAPTVRRMLSNKIEANAQKGMAGKPLRLMVVGIPNTGKSSFINRMAGKNKAKLRTSRSHAPEPVVQHRERHRAARHARRALAEVRRPGRRSAPRVHRLGQGYHTRHRAHRGALSDDNERELSREDKREI